jgi:FeS assembly SUF system protein
MSGNASSASRVTEQQVIAALKTCYDPEIPMNIYDLGLIYEVKVNADDSVYIKMTLTAPNCPVAGSLPEQVRARVAALPGVARATVELTFDPPWTKNKMSDLVKLELGLT